MDSLGRLYIAIYLIHMEKDQQSCKDSEVNCVFSVGHESPHQPSHISIFSFSSCFIKSIFIREEINDIIIIVPINHQIEFYGVSFTMSTICGRGRERERPPN